MLMRESRWIPACAVTTTREMKDLLDYGFGA